MTEPLQQAQPNPTKAQARIAFLEAELAQCKREMQLHEALLDDLAARMTSEHASQMTQLETLTADLEAERRQMRRILDTMQDALISVSLPERRLIYISAAFERVFGYPVQVFLDDAEFFKHIIHPDDLSLVLDSMQTCLREGFIELDHRIILPDGQVRWLHRRAWVIYDAEGRPLQVNDSARDITPRKQAEAALRLSEERYRRIVEDQTNLVCRYDENLTVTFGNSAYCKNFGVPPEEIIGKSILTRIPPEERESALAHVRSLTRDNPTAVSIHRSILPDQRIRWIEWTDRAIFNEQGEVVEYQGVGRDITEQRQAERDLQAAHDLLEQRVNERTAELERARDRIEAIFNHSGDGILLLDIHRGIQQANDTFNRLFALAPDSYLGMKLPQFFQPEDAAAIEAIVEAVAATHQTQHIEAKAKRADAAVLDVEISVAPVNRSENAVVNLVCIIRDVSRRKQAEAALRQKYQEELEMQTCLKALHDITLRLTRVESIDAFFRCAVEEGRAHFGFDRMGIVLYDDQNQTISGTYGTDLDGSTVDRHQLQLGMEHLPGIFRQTMNRAEMLAFDSEAQLYNDYTSLGLGQQAVAALWNSELLGWLGVDNAIRGEPLTQAQRAVLALYALTVGSLLARKRAEFALRESETRYRLLAENVRDVIVKVSPDGICTFVTPSIDELLGYRPDELIGQPAHAVVHPEDRAATQASVTEALCSGAPFFTLTQRNMHKDGHAIWVEVTGSIVRDPGTGEPLEIVGVIHDITERKQAEQALQQALAHEKELGELKSRFVSMASHEFRTPLAVILASAETLSIYRARMDETQISARLDTIRQQVMHMKDIMEDVLQLARIQARQLEFNPLPANLDSLCREIIAEFEMQPEYQQRIIYRHLNGHAWLSFDMRLMRQIITNLIANALKYSLNNSHIIVELTQDDAHVVFKVSDQGIGIPPDDLKRLFEPFHRAANVGTIDGTGLGLSIAKQAVELHSGTIHVESLVGAGTIFTVTFPVTAGKDDRSDV